MSDHSRPCGSAGVVNSGAAPRRQKTVGLPRKTDSQCGQGIEESGAAELRGAELMMGGKNDTSMMMNVHPQQQGHLITSC